jgi:hypothetical protein
MRRRRRQRYFDGGDSELVVSLRTSVFTAVAAD